MTERARSDPSRELEKRLVLFAVLYATAALFEMRVGPLRILDAPNAVNVAKSLCCVSAIWLLLRPGSVERLAAFAALHASAIFTVLPRGPNHWVLELLVDLALVTAWLMLRSRAPAAAVDGRRYYEWVAPPLRWVVLALYFWAIVHKLNTDFLDRDVSCASVQLFRLEKVWPFLPRDAVARDLAIYGTLLVEAAIPILLCARRTRLLGVCLAVGFHWSLGFLYTGFSAGLFAFFSLFLPGHVFEAWSRRQTLLRRAVAGAAAFAAMALGVTLAYPDHVFTPIGLGWMAYGLLALALLLPSLWPVPWRAAEGPSVFAAPAPALLVFPLLVFVNGMNPYLGLRNIQAFAMFSNLRTEEGRTNHLLIPSSWQVFDYQRDLVTIEESSDRVLQELTRPRRSSHFFGTVAMPFGHPILDAPPDRWRLPFVSLRNRVAHYRSEGRSDLRIVYVRDGERVVVERAEEDPEFSGMPYLVRKFLLLRLVPVSERGLCLW